MPKLTVEIVPETAHYSNLRTELPRRIWDRLRKDSYRAADYRCEVCGDKGPTHPVEAHERWGYRIEGRKGVQTLHQIISLCPPCHEVKHYGLAQVRGREQEAFSHLAFVNKWTSKQTRSYLEDQALIHRIRSVVLWRLDVSLIESLGQRGEHALDVMRKRDESNAERVRGGHLDDEVALNFLEAHQDVELAVPQVQDSTEGFRWL